MSELENKYDQLTEYLKKLESCAVAYSGGVDSTFLLSAANDALGDNAVGITVFSPYIPKWEIEESKVFVKKMGARHSVIKADIPEEIKQNPPDRCYLCKQKVFALIWKEAKRLGMQYLLDGSNYDDTKDYRPGMKALKELRVKSPLLELGFTKQEIRDLSELKGLETWDKPPYACLLTRIPFGWEVNQDELVRIERSEVFLMSLGFRAVRVRSHDDIARIELGQDERKKIMDEKFMDRISEELKSYGYRYVCLELSGYKMGSMNKT